MRRSHWKISAFAMALVLSVFAMAACNNKDPEPVCEAPVVSSSALPISFPYIFSGKFTVDGEPGPAGIPMFACVGNQRGLFNDTKAGEYTNVSIAAQVLEGSDNKITFHLGHPDGATVQATETSVFNVLSQPQFETLDLSFPKLP